MNSKRLAYADELIPLMEERIKNGGSVRFTPRGISMLPMLRSGLDSVVLSPAPEKLKKYDVPLYRRDNGRYVLHRVVGVGETYTCIGDNQFKKEKGIRQDQIVAVVTSFIRKGKEYDINNFGYKLYCRAWHYTRFPRRAVRSLKYRLGALFKRIKLNGK